MDGDHRVAVGRRGADVSGAVLRRMVCLVFVGLLAACAAQPPAVSDPAPELPLPEAPSDDDKEEDDGWKAITD